MSDKKAETISNIVAELAKDFVPAPWGGVSSVLISKYGKKPIQYFLPSEDEESRVTMSDAQPDFAVIGMGRCGSHIAVALNKMVSHEASTLYDRGANRSKTVDVLEAMSSWLSILHKESGEQSLGFKPVMLVGDTDETTFSDVKGLTVKLQNDEEGAVQEPSFLTLSYLPLASRGVGHNPIISQYFTRALLILPEMKSYGWTKAKRFLLSVENNIAGNNTLGEEKTPPRLAFYVFSSGGGTGCGA